MDIIDFLFSQQGKDTLGAIAFLIATIAILNIAVVALGPERFFRNK